MDKGPVVVIVNPNASGLSLSEAIAERGGLPIHIWHDTLQARYAADPTERKLLHHDLAETVSAIADMTPVAVLAGSEFGVNLANELAIAMALPHNDPRLALARRDKQHMLQAVKAAGLPVPASFAVSDATELKRVLAEITGYPVMVKPKDSAGSDGCAMCHDEKEAVAAFSSINGQINYMGMHNNEVLVQDFIQGPQYFIDTVSIDGCHYLTDVFLYRIDNLAGKPVIRDSILRADLTAEERSAVGYTFSCLTALGIQNGAAHTEVRLTPSGPMLIEVNSRLMGPVLHADPFLASLGYSQATVLAEAVLNRRSFASLARSDYQPKRTLGHVMLRTRQTGTITAMPGLSEIRRLPGFHSMTKLPRIGTQVSPDNPLTIATTGLAYFIHDDHRLVRCSMDTVHEMEDANQVFSVT